MKCLYANVSGSTNTDTSLQWWPIKHNRRNISCVCKAILLKKLEENNCNGNLRASEKESLILFYYEHVSTSRKYRKVCTHKGSGVEGWLIMLTCM